MARLDTEIYRFLLSWRRIYSSPLNQKLKGNIFRTLFRVFFIQRKILRINKGYFDICGYKVIALDLNNLYALFTEIYSDQNYYFHSNKNDPLIIDCGSNIGLSILYFKLLYPQAEIIGFEPDDAAYAVLEKNISNNKLQKVELFQKALSNYEGMVDFFYDQNKPGSTKNSLLRERNSVNHKTVSSTLLSKYINKEVDLLKLDVEGVELIVLEDLLQSDKLDFIQQMIIEYHHHVVKDEDKLSITLALLEQANFGYHIQTKYFGVFRKEQIEDILIYAYRKANID